MKRSVFSVGDLLKTVVLLVAAYLASALLLPFSGAENNSALIFVLAVVLISRITKGYLYGLTASIVSMFCINYFFTYPYSRFDFTLSGYPLSFLVLLVISSLICALTARAKRQTELALRRENEAKELLSANQRLSEEQQEIRMIAEQEKIRGDMLRAISHDLRTPLTSIFGSSAALLSDSSEQLSDNGKKLLADIRDDSEWLIRMIENLLIVTKLDNERASLKKTEEAAEELVAEAVVQTKKRYPSLKVEAKVPDELLLVPMDPILIEQVLINLLENAIRHSGDTSQIRLNVTIEEQYAVFSVSDRGRGLSEEVLESLKSGGRQPLNTGGDSTRGLGIGLSVCQSIVKAHRGFFKAENAAGGGAVFRFGLPLTNEKQEVTNAQ